jgi:hypothetical protein
MDVSSVIFPLQAKPDQSHVTKLNMRHKQLREEAHCKIYTGPWDLGLQLEYEESELSAFHACLLVIVQRGTNGEKFKEKQ